MLMEYERMTIDLMKKATEASCHEEQL